MGLVLWCSVFLGLPLAPANVLRWHGRSSGHVMRHDTLCVKEGDQVVFGARILYQRVHNAI